MSLNCEEMDRLVKRVESLAEELKLVSLNLTVANAKLRLKDNAFQAVGSSMGELLDHASAAHEQAENAVRRIKGERVKTAGSDAKPPELDLYLNNIKSLAEYIIRTVVAIKQGRVDQRS